MLRTDSQRVPPLNTGKVRIGSAYMPPVRWFPSRDAYDLQTALLARPGVRASLWVRLTSWLYREAV